MEHEPMTTAEFQDAVNALVAQWQRENERENQEIREYASHANSN